MRRLYSFVAATLALGVCLAIYAPPGHAGGAKSHAWKLFLTDQAYDALSKRSLKRIGALAGDEKSRDGLIEKRLQNLIDIGLE